MAGRTFLPLLLYEIGDIIMQTKPKEAHSMKKSWWKVPLYCIVALNIVLGIFTYATQRTFTFFAMLWSELTEWDSVFSQILLQLNLNEWVSAVIIWVLPPYIFLLFGKKEVHTD